MPVKAIIITFLAFVLMGILISIFTTYMIKEDEVLNLLKGTQNQRVSQRLQILLQYCV
ncbi:hypothetical protein JTT01_03380 [Clostridium botulinum]|nr:hypothetical protein [Clostridium botulinum]